MLRSLVGSEMCIRDRGRSITVGNTVVKVVRAEVSRSKQTSGVLSRRFPSSFPFQIEPNDSRSYSVSTLSFPIPRPRCLKFPFQTEPNDSRSHPAHVVILVPFPSYVGRIWTRLYPSQRELRKVASGSHSREDGSQTNCRQRRARRSHPVPRVPQGPV